MVGSISGEGTNVGGCAPNALSADFAPNAPLSPAGGSPNAPVAGGSAPNASTTGGSAPNAPAGGTASNVPAGGFASSAQKRISCKKKNIASDYGLFCVL